jgi:hypothetical protein
MKLENLCEELLQNIQMVYYHYRWGFDFVMGYTGKGGWE